MRVGTVALRRRAGETLVLVVWGPAGPGLPTGTCRPGESAQLAAARVTREQAGCDVMLAGDPVPADPDSSSSGAIFFPAILGPGVREGTAAGAIRWLALPAARSALGDPADLHALDACAGRVRLPACLLVDADACPRPCLAIVYRLARVHRWQVVTVASFHHDLGHTGDAEHVVVGDEPEATDVALANRVRPGDVVVTQDYGLAALVLAKQAFALGPGGRVYTRENIDLLLVERHLQARWRRGGGRTRGPGGRTPDDDQRFAAALRLLLAAASSSG